MDEQRPRRRMAGVPAHFQLDEPGSRSINSTTIYSGEPDLTQLETDVEHSGEKAWHWRRWVEIQDAGSLREEYDRQFLSDAELADQRQSGAVATANQIFAARKAEA